MFKRISINNGCETIVKVCLSNNFVFSQYLKCSHNFFRYLQYALYLQFTFFIKETPKKEK